MDPHRPSHSLDSVHDAHNDEQHDNQPIQGHSVPVEHPFVIQPAPVSVDLQQPELSEDVLMHDSVYDSMPELQSVSDSDSDREADEVEMQAVDADVQDGGGPAAPITREDIDIVFDSFRPTPLRTPSSESTGGDNPRPNRRARVEDDDDEERDRRHPSQRVNDPSNSNSSSASTSSFAPTPSTPSQSATPTPPPPHRHHHHHHHHLPPNTYFSAAIGIPRRQGDSPLLRLFQHVDGGNTNNNANNNNGANSSNPATPAPAAGPSGSVPAGPANNNTNTNPTPQAPLPPQQPAGRPPRVIEGLTLAFEFGPHGLVMTNPPPRNGPTNQPQGPNAPTNADGDHPPPLGPPTVPNSPTNANTNGPRPVNLGNFFTNLMARFAAGGGGAGGAAGAVPGGDFEGPQFTPININLNLGDGVPFPFPFVSGFGQEKDDPERAKRLVEGLEEVPVGLVRRLERVGGTGGGMGEDSMAGGDAGCAICWDRLLDPDGEGFGKEESGTEKSTRTEEGGEAAQDESDEGSSSSSTKEPSKEEKKYPKIVSLPCAHVFHADCLVPWFSRPRHTTCPTCRFNIDPDNLTYVSASQRRRREREEAGRRRRESGEEAVPANANPTDNNANRDGENEVDDPFASINAAIQRAANNAAAATGAGAPPPPAAQSAGTLAPAAAGTAGTPPAPAPPAPAAAGAAPAPGTGTAGAPRPGLGMQSATIQTPQGTVNVIQVPIPIVIPVQVPVGAPRQTARRTGTPIVGGTQPQPQQQGAPAQAPPQPAPAPTPQPQQQAQPPPQQPQGGNSDFARFLSQLFQTALGAAAGAVNGVGAPPTPPGGGAPGVGAGAAGPIGAPPLPMPVPNGWQYMGSAVFNGTFGLGGPQGQQGQGQGRGGQQGQQGQQPQGNLIRLLRDLSLDEGADGFFDDASTGLNFSFPGMTGTNVQMGPLPPGFNFPAGFPFNIPPPANPQPNAAPAAANNNNAAPATPPTNNAPAAPQSQSQPQPNPPANATNIPGQPAGLPPPVNPFSHRLGQPGMPPLPGVVGYTIDMVIDGPAGAFAGMPGFPPLGTFGAAPAPAGGAQAQGPAQGQAQGAAGARDQTPPPELVFEGAQMVIDLDEDGPAPVGDNNNDNNNGNNERPEIARMRNLEEIFDLIEQDDREAEMQAQQDAMFAALLNQRQGQAQQQGQAPAPAGQGQQPPQHPQQQRGAGPQPHVHVHGPHGHGLTSTNAPPPLFGGGPLPAGVHIAAGSGRTVQEAWGQLFNTMRQPLPGQGQAPPAQGTQPQAQAGDAPAAQGQQPQQQGQAQVPPPMGPAPPPPGFRMFTSFADFMNGGAPERDNRPKRTWTLPPAPGPTLRQRIERKEREAGLRCSDVSCGIGPSDEEPFGSSESEGGSFKQLSIKSRKGDGEALCPHTFHSSCLVTAERVALSAKGTEEVVETEDGKVEVSCPVCRGVGCVSREEWDEGVGALAALALA